MRIKSFYKYNLRMELMKYTHVIHNGREYIIIFRYTPGYCEIQEKNNPYNVFSFFQLMT